MTMEEYRVNVCRQCPTQPVCQYSNIEDCMHRDEETDAYGPEWELQAAAVNRNLAQRKLEAILNSEGIANGTTDSS